MKKMTRRMFVALSATMMVAALGLGGCAGGDGAQENGSVSDAGAGGGSSAAKTQGAEPAGEPAGEAVTLQIFAANSLTKAMAEAQELYTQQNPNVTFGDTQYEASGTLNEMLGAGQYADILITASKGTMDDAVDAGYVDEATRSTMFTNQLVFVTKEGGELADTDVTLEDVAAGTYTLSVGDENVPAGNYACQALSTVGAYIEPDGATGADATGKGGVVSDAL